MLDGKCCMRSTKRKWIVSYYSNHLHDRRHERCTYWSAQRCRRSRRQKWISVHCLRGVVFVDSCLGITLWSDTCFSMPCSSTNFPMLSILHLEERHDSFFAAALGHNQTGYNCLLTSCRSQFRSNEERHCHMVQAYDYPTWFRCHSMMAYVWTTWAPHANAMLKNYYTLVNEHHMLMLW
jgi:hypothetical protein